jgi:hypothetical protein
LAQLGETAVRDGAYDEAGRYLRAGFELASQHAAAESHVSGLIETVAFMTAAKGDGKDAALLASVVDGLAESLGTERPSEHEGEFLPYVHYRSDLDRVRDALGAATFEASYARGGSLELDDAIELARSCLD